MSKNETEIYIVKGAKTIMDTKYPSFNFVVENLIPSSGLILLAGAPKTGKSWFVLQMLLSICFNKIVFIGHRIIRSCKCLYLSLEDSESRIKARIKKQGFNPDDDKLLFAFTWRSNEKGVYDIRDFLRKNEDVKIVCIDTKGKFSQGREDENFQADYTWMSDLKNVADEMKVAIILVTHFRKKRADEDPFEVIAGTYANMAAADTTIMLKRLRNQNKGMLSVTSRDFQEIEEDIFFDIASCTWNAPSGNKQRNENLTPERQKILDAIYQIGSECSPQEIADIVGGTSKNISNMLGVMKSYGFVENGTKRGLWTIPEMCSCENDIE